MKRLLVAALWLAAGLSCQAVAQEATAPTGRPQTDPLSSLVEVMKDDGLRTQLIREIERIRPGGVTDPSEKKEDKLPAATETEPQPASVINDRGLVAAVMVWLNDLGERLPTAALGAPIEVKLAQAGDQLETRLNAPDASAELQDFGLRSAPGWALVTGVAFFALVLVRRRIRARVERSAPLGQVSKEAAVRSLLATLPLVACFAIAAAWSRLFGFSHFDGVIFFLLTAPFAMALAVSEIMSSVFLLLVATKGWRIVAYGQRRLAPLLGVLTGVATAGSLMAVTELRDAVGPATADICSLVLDVATPLVALFIVIRHRRTIRALITRGHAPDDDASPLDRATYWIGSHWRHLGGLFVVLNIGARLFGGQTGGFLTRSLLSVGLIVLALIASASLRRTIERRSARAKRPVRRGVRTVVFERVGAMLLRTVQIAIAIGAVIACLRLWDVRVIDWMGSHAGSSVIGPAASIAIVAVTAWTFWVVLDAWITAALAPSDARQRSARVMTLLPLLRNFVFVALTVLTVIGVLANIGINVAPLIAGAGVIGLAVGFGSQQLVQDVITGLFILLEDSLAIGDVIDTGDRSGVVEALTIRTVKVRDGDGALHSIPFSTIKAIKNASRGFGVYTASVTLDVEADVEKAIDVFREVGDDIRNDERFAGKIVAPLDVWGVDQVGLDGVVIKASIKTLPLQQHGVGREINRRVRDSLQNAGVKLATRSQMGMAA